MIAGTLAVLDATVDDPLEPFIREGSGYPALTIGNTQTTHGDATPQTGTAAAKIKTNTQHINTGADDGEPYIDRDRDEVVEAIATDWAADTTGSGVILAESIGANEKLPFPFDVFGGLTDTAVERKQIRVRDLHAEWASDGGLSKVSMSASDRRGTAITYDGQANPDEVEPTLGLGFERSWNGTTIEGICWASGYVALYNARHAADGLQFVASEILPYAETWDPDEHEEQTDFDEFGGGA